jgi:hypothetical protein
VFGGGKEEERKEAVRAGKLLHPRHDVAEGGRGGGRRRGREKGREERKEGREGGRGRRKRGRDG